MTYLARARAVAAVKPWSDVDATNAIAKTMRRLGRACVYLDGFATDQRQVDLHEAVNVAAARRDRAAFEQALAAYERHCLNVYAVRASR